MVQYQAFTKRFSQQLESLRGISAIVVLFTHCFQAFIAPFDQTIYPLIRLLGQSAVMMFFVLSGYLIGHSIQKNIHLFGRFNIWHYLKQRCKRILPPFIFALALTALLYVLAPLYFASQSHAFVHDFGLMIRNSYDINLTDFIGTAFFLNGFITSTVSANAALWSLSYEVWFYILAICIPLAHQKNMIIALVASALLVGLAYLNIQFFFYFLVWLAAFLLSFQSIRSLISAQLDILQHIFIGLALCIACFDFYQFHYVYMGQFYSTENFTWFNVCVGLAICCWLARLHQNKTDYAAPLPQTAHYSYTLYVTHFPLLLFIMGVFPQTLSNGIFGGLISLIMVMIILIGVAKFLAYFLEANQKQSSKKIT